MGNHQTRLWDGITENDFINEQNIESVDIGEYDKHNMTLFAANVNIWRQLRRLSDSLKPVERRILFGMYQIHAFPGNKSKSPIIVGTAAKYHGHGDTALYATMVGMSQAWKLQCPLISGKGNFGNAARPDMFAAARYTEASMSKYAKECFFEDYEEDCVETVFNSAADIQEPVNLPAKFPNILVNGGMGIAFGNAFRVPTYNINDIITVCKRVIENPDTANVFMIPDLPSGCIIVDDGQCFHDIVDTGKGILKMRANIETIEGKNTWIFKITSLPWMVSLTNVEDRLISLVESGSLPLKDKQDHSYGVFDKDGNVQMQVDYRLIFDKAQDPQTILNKLFSSTDLQKSVSIDFKVVLDDLTIERLNMRDLVNSWINERRSYKRRLFNKKLNKMSARIDLLEVLIYLLKEDNIEKTIRIIKDSDSSEVVKNLMRLGKMTSYQASKIAEMRLSAFTKDARVQYKVELEKLIKDREDLMILIRSEKKIDQIIINELEDLRKYANPRKSMIMSENTEKYIADTEHSIVISNDNMIKKLPLYKDRPEKNFVMGAFRSGDYPIRQLTAHNSASLVFYDTFGRYSIIPLHEIDNTESSQYGYKIFDITKLSGKIVCCMEAYDNDLIDVMRKNIGEPYLLTVTKRGYAKKTPMSTYTEMKSSRNIRAMKIRDDDSMIIADVVFDNATIILYTKNGQYLIINMSDIYEQNKDSMGVITMRVDEDDEIAGYAIISNEDEYLVILSDKGMCKKVPIKYFGSPSKRNSVKDQGSMMTLDPTDKIVFVSGISDSEQLVVVMKNSVEKIDSNVIPDTTKKSKGVKLIHSSSNSNIVVSMISPKSK